MFFYHMIFFFLYKAFINQLILWLLLTVIENIQDYLLDGNHLQSIVVTELWHVDFSALSRNDTDVVKIIFQRVSCGLIL